MIMMGVMLPIFSVHTLVGFNSFIDADVLTCKNQYKGSIFYVILLMFAASFLLIFFLLFFFVCVPVWVKEFKEYRRN